MLTSTPPVKTSDSLRKTWKKSPISRSVTTTSSRKSSGKARAITTLARTSLRYCNASRVNRLPDQDFGCGPGRDLKVFAELGHVAGGFQGAAHFAAMAHAHTGCDMAARIPELDLPDTAPMAYSPRRLADVPSQKVAARVAGTARKPETGWRTVQFKPAPQ